MAFARLQHAQRDDAPISDINATPLVDVFLVLWVIFMLYAPLELAHLPLELPQASGGNEPLKAPAGVMVDLDAQGRLHWQGRVVGQAELLAALQNLHAQPGITRLQLRADQATAYGQVVALMAALQAQGWVNMDLVVRPLKPA
ncbi:MAG: biopolymer transporter ExbD [Betaproteobacteria bacterium]|nr:biopolymer transporter ExbD [Betaproteobacteria bacterium]NBY04020.1 biopolymer transporter ExbD [Betaproteobacteria bacterium]